MNINIELHIKDVRQKKGLSIRQLAELSGISKTHISAIENNETMPTVYTVCCLAVALGVDLPDLVSYKKA